MVTPGIRIQLQQARAQKMGHTYSALAKREPVVHVYFDNDAESAVPRSALTLLQMLR